MNYPSHGLHQSFLIPTGNIFNLTNRGSNLALIEMTFPLNSLVGITLLCVQTFISLDVFKSFPWISPFATLERRI